MRSICIAIGCLLGAASLHAQTLNWGNEIFGEVVDSLGNEVDNTFVFELGAFDSGFTPTQGNIGQWYDSWNVFDYTSYDTNDDRFTSTVFVEHHTDIGGDYGAFSSNPGASAMNFSGLDAYIWIRKGNTPVEGTEWLLVRAGNWTFPTVGGGCCSNGLLEWSTASDLGTTVPLWGRQHATEGPGVGIFDEGSYGPLSPTLQTFTFVPEPSACLMGMLAAMGMVFRRRRPRQDAI